MALRRGLLWIVLVALVSAQTLGLMHRVVHSPALETAFGTATAAVAEPAHFRGGLSDLFDQHDNTACRVVDQLCHGGFPPGVPVVLPHLLLPTFVLAWFQGEFIARRAALFDARGPPLLR